ncbi:glycosyltransferase family 39 protein [Candidatus Microgenomates bacterium]|nr:glycosyltransferase family 39 protein [Candidatus Microgenomates bacterium]
MKLSTICLVLIIILTSLLRFYKLTDDPPHLYWDEAAIAYNAYSVNLTGKDEWGEKYPVLFKSFGEYKLPFYIYATTVSQKIFGLNDFSVRLPSALAGTLLILASYYLVKQLFFTQKTALLASLFVAIAPWALQFSRAGFEANVALLFVTLGVFLFLRQKLVVSFLFFAAAIYTYQGAVIATPLILALLVFVHHKILHPWGKRLLPAVVLFLVVIWPFFSSYVLSDKGHTRATSENFLNMPGSPATNFVTNYVSNYSLDYLFFHGDQDGRHSVKKLGQLYLWQLPTIFIGLYVLLRRRTTAGCLIIGWILIANLPPALTTVSPHALRGLLAMVGWQILSAVGAVFLLTRLPRFWRFLGVAIFAYALVVYLHLYYVHYPIAYAADWQDGRRQTIAFVKSVEANYDHIYIGKDFEPIYLRLYWPIEPGKELGKFVYFDPKVEPPPGPSGQRSLIIAPPWFTDPRANVIRQIKMAGGEPIFNVYDF